MQGKFTNLGIGFLGWLERKAFGFNQVVGGFCHGGCNGYRKACKDYKNLPTPTSCGRGDGYPGAIFKLVQVENSQYVVGQAHFSSVPIRVNSLQH